MSKQQRSSSKHWTLILALVLASSTGLLAQESPFTASMKATFIQPVQPSPFVHGAVPAGREHRFLNRGNTVLFAAVGGMAAADFCVTRSNLAHGGRELNPVTSVLAGSTTGLALNFVGETAGSIGISYLFHKTGHHKLERMTSFVNIGASAGAVGYGLSHR
jgi:hypothetical protein